MAPQVLLVEPSSDLRRTYTRLLERRGLFVQATATAAEALAMCETFSPDIVIADHDLADECSAELVRELRRSHAGVVVLLTTNAFARQQTIGPLTLIPKPSEPRQLLDLLKRAVTSDSLWHVRRGRAAG